MRAFIAIDLPEEIKEFFSNIQKKLKSSGADVKWVAPENIHITLKFLGETDDKAIRSIENMLDALALNLRVFKLSLKSLGAFPSLHSPRVIWIGINKGKEDISGLAKLIEEKASNEGFKKETRPFSAHITIGRSRSGLNRMALIKLMEEVMPLLDKEPREFNVSGISLFKSTLTPKGPVYELIKEANLRAH